MPKQFGVNNHGRILITPWEVFVKFMEVLVLKLLVNTKEVHQVDFKDKLFLACTLVHGQEW